MSDVSLFPDLFPAAPPAPAVDVAAVVARCRDRIATERASWSDPKEIARMRRLHASPEWEGWDPANVTVPVAAFDLEALLDIAEHGATRTTPPEPEEAA